MTQTSSNLQTRALVVGGGPVGWLSALALARAGLQTTLVAREEPEEDHRTIALMQGSLSFLDTLGIAPETIENATPLKTMRLIDASARLIRAPEVSFHASEIGHDYFALNIPVSGLVKRIQQKASTGSNLVCKNGFVTNISLTDGVTVTLDDGSFIHADLIVGADGRHSVVRAAAGISVRQWDYPQTAFITQFRHQVPHHNISSELHTETGPFTLVPLQGHRSSLVCVVTPDEAAEMMQLSETALARELERRSHHLLGKLSDFGARQSFPMSSSIAAKMADGRAFLVGESGHSFPPIGAQGLNLGIRDVEELASQLAHLQAADVFQASAEYSRRRVFDVNSRTYGVDMLNRSLLSGLLPVQMARGLGLYAAKSISPLRRTLMRQGLGAYSN
uniref:FAD-dependent monooxygenase n=1 Tax=Pararhizobium sp. IMCC3301 TaxID=3067904 RepID=UPI0027411935|nr:FAD-dependent monooxygenase [Pararhizobium sp. IMCC3301]